LNLSLQSERTFFWKFQDRVRKVAWIEGGTQGEGGCASLCYHGFGCRDAGIVSEVIEFVPIDESECLKYPVVSLAPISLKNSPH
jgi:hypothetical protein